MLFGDINGLKLINDTFGHQAGDKLLSKTAKIIQSKLVDEENIYRIGGDEFVVLSKDVNPSRWSVISSGIYWTVWSIY